MKQHVVLQLQSLLHGCAGIVIVLQASQGDGQVHVGVRKIRLEVQGGAEKVEGTGILPCCQVHQSQVVANDPLKGACMQVQGWSGADLGCLSVQGQQSRCRHRCGGCKLGAQGVGPLQISYPIFTCRDSGQLQPRGIVPLQESSACKGQRCWLPAPGMQREVCMQEHHLARHLPRYRARLRQEMAATYRCFPKKHMPAAHGLISFPVCFSGSCQPDSEGNAGWQPSRSPMLFHN